MNKKSRRAPKALKLVVHIEGKSPARGTSRAHTVSFEVSRADSAIIRTIAIRAVAMAAKDGIGYSLTEAMMDITACHANGNPLRLDELARADDANFGHDVYGIRRFLNRDTGRLYGAFSPRYSARERERGGV